MQWADAAATHCSDRTPEPAIACSQCLIASLRRAALQRSEAFGGVSADSSQGAERASVRYGGSEAGGGRLVSADGDQGAERASFRHRKGNKRDTARVRFQRASVERPELHSERARAGASTTHSIVRQINTCSFHIRIFAVCANLVLVRIIHSDGGCGFLVRSTCAGARCESGPGCVLVRSRRDEARVYVQFWECSGR